MASIRSIASWSSSSVPANAAQGRQRQLAGVVGAAQLVALGPSQPVAAPAGVKISTL